MLLHFHCVAAGGCHLPELDPLYGGRDVEAAGLVEQLRSGARAICLLADGGMGKSSLALEVGWRLHRQGDLAGGALLVDLREATSADMVISRFCASFGLSEVRLLDMSKSVMPDAYDILGGCKPAIPPAPLMINPVLNAQGFPRQ